MRSESDHIDCRSYKRWGLMMVAAWRSRTRTKQNRTGGQTSDRQTAEAQTDSLSTRTESYYPPPYLRFTLYDSERVDAGPCRNKVVNLNDISALNGCLVFWMFQYQCQYRTSCQPSQLCSMRCISEGTKITQSSPWRGDHAGQIRGQ